MALENIPLNSLVSPVEEDNCRTAQSSTTELGNTSASSASIKPHWPKAVSEQVARIRFL